MRVLLAMLLNIGLAACVAGDRPARTSGAPDASIGPAGGLQVSAFTFFERADASAKAEENTFVSPLSLQQAMGLVQAGAVGQTATEIEAAFGLSPGTAGAAQLEMQRKAVVGTHGQVRVKIANALWLSQRLTFRPSYLETARQRHEASAERLDFAGDRNGSANWINVWAKRETEGLIPVIVSPASFDAATAAILTNAVFFEGGWQHFFSPATPQPFLFGDGNERSFPLMNKVGDYRYAEAAGWKAVRLPYGDDSRFVMDVFVPKARNAETRLKAATFAALVGRLDRATAEPVDITLPRCEIAWERNLNKVLQEMGIVSAFNPAAADLTAMAEGTRGILAVNSVRQLSKLQIFETGTRAAAVTVVEIAVTGAPINQVEPKVLRADQPFHLAIRDTKSGTILFIGRIAKPEIYTGEQLPSR